MEKKQIRQMIAHSKKQMTSEEIERYSAQLTEVFCALPEFQSAACLYAYLSFNQEVRTAGIIETALQQGKMVAVPRIISDRIEFRYISSIEECLPGHFGIFEPGEKMALANGSRKSILMLMPGLAFDSVGTRVGYGKGYYDRYLSEHTDCSYTKIALCYDFQLLETIPCEPFDQKADKIILAPSGRIVECRTEE